MSLTTILESLVLEEPNKDRVQIALRTQDEKPVLDTRRFMTHIKVLPDHDRVYYISGHYDMTIDEAMEDFNGHVASIQRIIFAKRISAAKEKPNANG